MAEFSLISFVTELVILIFVGMPPYISQFSKLNMYYCYNKKKEICF